MWRRPHFASGLRQAAAIVRAQPPPMRSTGRCQECGRSVQLLRDPISADRRRADRYFSPPLGSAAALSAVHEPLVAAAHLSDITSVTRYYCGVLFVKVCMYICFYVCMWLCSRFPPRRLAPRAPSFQILIYE